MHRFLKAKMLERNISNEDIAKTIDRTPRSVRGKIAEETSFTHPEIMVIKDAYFPDIPVEILFASDKGRETA